MRYDVYGEGPALVLLPGLGCDSRMWGAMIDHLPLGCTYICPHTWEAQSIEKAANGVAEILDERGLDKAFVAGLSMGGYVAFELLRQHPEKVRAAALLDTTAHGDDAAKREKRQQTIKLIEAGKYSEVLPLFIDSVLWPEGELAAPARDLMGRMGEAVGPEGFARSMNAIMERGELTDVLEDTLVPLLFLAGAHDEMTPPDLAAAMAAQARKASFVEIARAGHMSALESPAAVAGALWEFFMGNLAVA